MDVVAKTEAGTAASNAGAAAAKRMLEPHDSLLGEAAADATKHQKKRTKAAGGAAEQNVQEDGEELADASPTGENVEMRKVEQVQDGKQSAEVVSSEGLADGAPVVDKKMLTGTELALQRLMKMIDLEKELITGTAEAVVAAIMMSAVPRSEVCGHTLVLIKKKLHEYADAHNMPRPEGYEVRRIVVAVLRLAMRLEKDEIDGKLKPPARELLPGSNAAVEMQRMASEAKNDENRRVVYAAHWKGFVNTGSDMKIPDSTTRMIANAADMVDNWLESERRQNISNAKEMDESIDEIASNVVASDCWPSWLRLYLLEAIEFLHLHNGLLLVDASVCLATLYGIGFGIEYDARTTPKGSKESCKKMWGDLVYENMTGDADGYTAYPGLFFDEDQLPFQHSDMSSGLLTKWKGKGKGGTGDLDFPNGGVAAKGTRVHKHTFEAEGCRFPVGKPLEYCLCKNKDDKFVLPRNAHMLEVEAQNKHLTFFSVIDDLEGGKDWDAVMKSGGVAGAVEASGRSESIRVDVKTGDNVNYATLTPQGAQTTETSKARGPLSGGEMSLQIPSVAATPMITPRSSEEEEKEGNMQEAAYTEPPPPPPEWGLFRDRARVWVPSTIPYFEQVVYSATGRGSGTMQEATSTEPPPPLPEWGLFRDRARVWVPTIPGIVDDDDWGGDLLPGLSRRLMVSHVSRTGLLFVVDPGHELSRIATLFLNSAAPFSDQGQQHQEQPAFCVLDSTQRIVALTLSWAQKVGLVSDDEAGPKSQLRCSAAAVGKNIREVVASDSAACPKALGEYLGSLPDVFRGPNDFARLRQDQDSQAAVTYYLNDRAQNCAEGEVIEFQDQLNRSSQTLYTGHTQVSWLIAAQDRKAAVKEKAFLLTLRDMTDQRRVDLMPSSPCSASADYQ
eukprot:g3545.t1